MKIIPKTWKRFTSRWQQCVTLQPLTLVSCHTLSSVPSGTCVRFCRGFSRSCRKRTCSCITVWLGWPCVCAREQISNPQDNPFLPVCVSLQKGFVEAGNWCLGWKTESLIHTVDLVQHIMEDDISQGHLYSSSAYSWQNVLSPQAEASSVHTHTHTRVYPSRFECFLSFNYPSTWHDQRKVGLLFCEVGSSMFCQTGCQSSHSYHSQGHSFLFVRVCVYECVGKTLLDVADSSFSHTLLFKWMCVHSSVCVCECVCAAHSCMCLQTDAGHVGSAQMSCPCLQDVLVHAGVSEPADSAAPSICMRTCWIIVVLLRHFSCCCWQKQKQDVFFLLMSGQKSNRNSFKFAPERIFWFLILSPPHLLRFPEDPDVSFLHAEKQTDHGNSVPVAMATAVRSNSCFQLFGLSILSWKGFTCGITTSPPWHTHTHTHFSGLWKRAPGRSESCCFAIVCYIPAVFCSWSKSPAGSYDQEAAMWKKRTRNSNTRQTARMCVCWRGRFHFLFIIWEEPCS